MSVIDNAVAHFNSKEVREKYIPEWDVTVFAHPLNMEQKGKWLAMAKGSNTDYLIYAVIYGAKNKEGKAIFTIEDKPTLKSKVDSDVLSEVAVFILGNSELPEEDREKN
jgi:hypothetical protein